MRFISLTGGSCQSALKSKDERLHINLKGSVYTQIQPTSTPQGHSQSSRYTDRVRRGGRASANLGSDGKPSELSWVFEADGKLIEIWDGEAMPRGTIDTGE